MVCEHISQINIGKQYPKQRVTKHPVAGSRDSSLLPVTNC
jgi:hypothetical protein